MRLQKLQEARYRRPDWKMEFYCKEIAGVLTILIVGGRRGAPPSSPYFTAFNPA
jgi:hypothetical protein